MVASRAIGSLSRFTAFRILRSRGEPGLGRPESQSKPCRNWDGQEAASTPRCRRAHPRSGTPGERRDTVLGPVSYDLAKGLSLLSHYAESCGDFGPIAPNVSKSFHAVRQVSPVAVPNSRSFFSAGLGVRSREPGPGLLYLSGSTAPYSQQELPNKPLGWN
jgi:hypothetical protein